MRDVSKNFFLSDLEFLADTPLSEPLARITWLVEPCTILHRLSHSPRLDSIVSCPLHIQTAPTVLQQVQGALDKTSLLRAVSGLYRTPERISMLENALEVHVFQRLEKVLKDGGGLDSSGASGTFTVALHAELALLAYLDTLSCRPFSYIGMSEPSCLPCYEFIAAYTEVSRRHHFYLRGSDCHTTFPWAVPPLHAAHEARIRRNFVEFISVDFAEACAELCRHLGVGHEEMVQETDRYDSARFTGRNFNFCIHSKEAASYRCGKIQ
ncbi:hypothetical protein EXIGLDRAFT_768567 [Exidia glandulosa HHB12029]|uniref:Uncharacterized protein n=1 Tax=Exidia glandulosa HHB12029 TaxID=1314781 RepID=A0A165I3D2_EXIGL|nr:hypothetical protein EXIGLDRAFT_768567 [Exidia glandulosa HHB12029]